MDGTRTTSSLMTIGAFARRTRLSLKALRLYDAMGLLVPTHVDGDSGYRYYDEDQLERAKLIGLLRQLDMPLSRIADVLELRGAEAAEAIARYGLEVEAGLRTKRKLVRYLESYLEGKGEADLPSFIDSSFDTLYGHLRRSGLQPGPVGFVVYHGEVNKDSDGPVEVCVPFTGSLEPEGEMRVRLEPAHHEGYTRITRARSSSPPS